MMTRLLPYFFPVGTTFLFVLALFVGVVSAQQACVVGDWWCGSFVAKLLLSGGYLLVAFWFLHAFTRADEKAADDACLAEQRASMFRFAYMFSVFSFALLMLPFTAMLRTHETAPDAGPVRLLRACVEKLPAGTTAPSSGPLEYCPDSKYDGVVTYPWLVAIGGVVARECDTVAACSKPDSTSRDSERRPPLYRVNGGFFVPFYVVVLSFVGGVVNLTRRIPEYQKRSSCNFMGTPTEPSVSLLEAREFVVFQIMQLLTSPFVAMVAYHALEPKSIASAAALAFFSGFATESVLLLLRGIFSGLQPASTKTVAASAAHMGGGAELRVQVKDAAGLPVDKATIEVRLLPTDSTALKTAQTDAKGVAILNGLPACTLSLRTWIEDGSSPLKRAVATQTVLLAAGSTSSIELQLA